MICFFTVAPMLVYYSMGYRYDFEKMKITKTGGIYVRTFPTSDEVVFDSKTVQKPDFLANDVFAQSLLPGEHNVLIKKENYHDYYKNIIVGEGLVTKLEEITLFKKDIIYSPADEKIKSPFDVKEKYIIKNNNLYYSDSKENESLTKLQKTTPVLKKVLTFTTQNDNIIWMDMDGFIYKSYQSDLTKPAEKFFEVPLEIKKNGTYKLAVDGLTIFINSNGNLLFLERLTKTFTNFHSGVKNMKISPDGKNIVFYDDNNIYVALIHEKTPNPYLLYKSETKITDLFWLNNYYVIFTAGNPANWTSKIMISEIDTRGNVNTVQLPEAKNPKIFFNSQEGKLYILTDKKLLVSEKLIP
jgi:hypothetical protein